MLHEGGNDDSGQLCSGGVATNATKEKSPLMLAGNSLFKPFEREMQAAHDRANNSMGYRLKKGTICSDFHSANAMAPELYAKEVIDQVSRPRLQSWLWIGTGSWVVRISCSMMDPRYRPRSHVQIWFFTTFFKRTFMVCLRPVISYIFPNNLIPGLVDGEKGGTSVGTIV